MEAHSSAYDKTKEPERRWNTLNPSEDYKLTDLDYLIGDHHLQMIKAALPYLGVPQQRAVSVFVKFQELLKTFELFETEEVASMGICSLDHDRDQTTVHDFLTAIRPYGNPYERDMIDMIQNFLNGKSPMEQLRKFLTPEQQSRFETMQMVITALQAMA
jgi:hypothetical protein